MIFFIILYFIGFRAPQGKKAKLVYFPPRSWMQCLFFRSLPFRERVETSAPVDFWFFALVEVCSIPTPLKIGQR